MELKKKEEILFKIEEQVVPDLPEVKDETKFDVSYDLIKPYVKAHIFWDDKESELVYSVDEPILNEREKKILAMLEEGVIELINISFLNLKSKDVVIEYLEKNIKVLLNEFGIKLSRTSFLNLMYYIYRDFVGLNKVEPLMNDYFIEDIECNGAGTPVYIVHRKYRNLRTNITYPKIPKLTNFVEKLAQKCGKYISYANPILDGSLPDGSRVNATFTQEISSKGPTFTIRKFTKIPWSPIKMMQFRTVSPELLAYLWILIEHEANIMVIGGTGSGKTTLLNTLAFFIPPQARVVSIEDTRELSLLHENWLPSVARMGIGMGEEGRRGEVDLFTLLKESFRQRPDYVIVGEVRGKEAYVLFQGMASGHPSLGTMHAEDVGTMIRRLETQPINLSPSLVDSLDVVCVMSQAKVGGVAVRRLRSIDEIISVSGREGSAKLNTPFVWDPRTDNFYFKTDSKIFDKIVIHRGISKERLFDEFNVRTKLLLELYKRKIFDYKEVHEVIITYYKNPLKVLRRFGIIK